MAASDPSSAPRFTAVDVVGFGQIANMYLQGRYLGTGALCPGNTPLHSCGLFSAKATAPTTVIIRL
jgi:hypothetical protein